MDTSGDGELSRAELVRAFRLDERVREFMLPLLPKELLGPSNTVTGVDLQAQVEAFETCFQRMDADVSRGLSKPAAAGLDGACPRPPRPCPPSA